MSNKNNKGYIIFNADGTQPDATLAALDSPKHVQVIVNGNGADIVKLFGSIVQSLERGGIDAETLHTTVDTAIKWGEDWAAYATFMNAKAREMSEKGITPEDIEDIDEAELAEMLGIDSDDE